MKAHHTANGVEVFYVYDLMHAIYQPKEGQYHWETSQYVADDYAASSSRLAAYCVEHNIFYYGRPKDACHEWEAVALAKEAGVSKVVIDSMS